MSKPIFLMRLPFNSSVDRETITNVQKDLQKKLHDYHVLVALDSKVDAAVFECFNNHNMTDRDFNEIKQTILQAIPS